MIEARTYEWIEPLPIPLADFREPDKKPTVTLECKRTPVYVITDLQEK